MAADELLVTLGRLAEVYDNGSMNDRLGESSVNRQIEKLSVLAYDQFDSLQAQAYGLLLQHANPLARLYGADAIAKTDQAAARIVYVALAGLTERDFGLDNFGRPRTDFLHFYVSDQAQRRIWFMQHGTDEGFEDAPERFWEQP